MKVTKEEILERAFELTCYKLSRDLSCPSRGKSIDCNIKKACYEGTDKITLDCFCDYYINKAKEELKKNSS